LEASGNDLRRKAIKLFEQLYFTPKVRTIDGPGTSFNHEY